MYDLHKVEDFDVATTGGSDIAWCTNIYFDVPKRGLDVIERYVEAAVDGYPLVRREMPRPVVPNTVIPDESRIAVMICRPNRISTSGLNDWSDNWHILRAHGLL